MEQDLDEERGRRTRAFIALVLSSVWVLAPFRTPRYFAESASKPRRPARVELAEGGLRARRAGAGAACPDPIIAAWCTTATRGRSTCAAATRRGWTRHAGWTQRTEPLGFPGRFTAPVNQRAASVNQRAAKAHISRPIASRSPLARLRTGSGRTHTTDRRAPGEAEGLSVGARGSQGRPVLVSSLTSCWPGSAIALGPVRGCQLSSGPVPDWRARYFFLPKSLESSPSSVLLWPRPLGGGGRPDWLRMRASRT